MTDVATAAPNQAIAFRTLGGSGADCLLLHGFGSDRLSWLGNLPALLPLATIHALDLPGHGESGLDAGDGSPLTLARRIEAELDARKLRSVHIIAHSLGGGVALLLADRRPELVASLALIAPAGLGEGVDAGFLHAYPELADAAAATELLQRLVVRPQLIGKQIAARVLEHLARPGARDALQRIATGFIEGEGGLRQAAVAATARVTPRLTIWGQEDAINRPSAARLEAFGGEQHVIAAAAHLPHIETAKQVNSLLAGFLQRVAIR